MYLVEYAYLAHLDVQIARMQLFAKHVCHHMRLVWRTVIPCLDSRCILEIVWRRPRVAPTAWSLTHWCPKRLTRVYPVVARPLLLIAGVVRVQIVAQIAIFAPVFQDAPLAQTLGIYGCQPCNASIAVLWRRFRTPVGCAIHARLRIVQFVRQH